MYLCLNMVELFKESTEMLSLTYLEPVGSAASIGGKRDLFHRSIALRLDREHKCNVMMSIVIYGWKDAC